MNQTNFKIRILVLLFCIFELFPSKIYSIQKYFVFSNLEPIKISILNSINVLEENKNIISWDNPNNDLIDFINIYRKSLVINDGSWIKIASVKSLNHNSYIDEIESNIANQFKYKISTLDLCSNEFFSLYENNTIILRVEVKSNGDRFLKWNHYQGIKMNNYKIFKGLKPDNLIRIDSTNFDNNTYPLNGNINQNEYFKIEVEEVVYDSINNSRKIIKSQSNTVLNLYDSLKNVDTNKNLKIQPNPLYDNSEIIFPFDISQSFVLNIYDLIGNVVYSLPMISGKVILNRNSINEGSYILQIKGTKICYTQKLIVGGRIK